MILAAILNFVGAFYSLKVAATIATGIVDTDAVTLSVILAGLVGAITWNLVTWFLALPSSSSHALIGGVAGAAIAAAGWDVIKWNGIWDKVVKPGVLSPTLGFLIALTMMFGIVWIIRKRSPSRVNRVFRRAQVVSGSFVAFTHGTNDAQKTMGIIALALIVSGHLDAEEFDVPLWVVASAALAMGLGTYAGGWRIIKTMGTRIAKIDPPQGFAAQTACAGILWTTANLGVPVSTTQTISGLRDGRRREPSPVGGSLGNRREHRHRVDPHAPRRRARRRAHGGRDADAAGQSRRVPARGGDRRGCLPRAALRDTAAAPRTGLSTFQW